MTTVERRLTLTLFWFFLMTMMILVSRSMGWGAEPGVYLSGELSQARFDGPAVDGTWTQERLPSRDGIPAVKQTKESMTWDLGAGYRFANGESWYSSGLSIEAGYRNYGSGVSAGGLAVSDEVYGEILAGHIPHHIKSVEYEATDHLQGGYLRIAKGFETEYGIEPFVSGGIEVLHHRLDFWARDRHGVARQGPIFTGFVAGPTVGGGLKYSVTKGLKVRVGVESHWMMTESGHPISSHWLTAGGGLEASLW